LSVLYDLLNDIGLDARLEPVATMKCAGQRRNWRTSSQAMC